jgi:hypothetical protein
LLIPNVLGNSIVIIALMSSERNYLAFTLIVLLIVFRGLSIPIALDLFGIAVQLSRQCGTSALLIS